MIVIHMDGPIAMDGNVLDRIQRGLVGAKFFKLLVWEVDISTDTTMPHFQVRGPRGELEYPLVHGKTVLDSLERVLLCQTIGYPIEVVYTERWRTQGTHPLPQMPE